MNYGERIIIGGGYENYLQYLLSDHIPIYLDFTDPKGNIYRVLFANTASLIGLRGIVDNSAAFGDITLANLQEWSRQLVQPLLEGMITLITENRDVLEWAGTWKTGTPWGKKGAGFKDILDGYKAKTQVRGVDMLQIRYATLKQLSKRTWCTEEQALQAHKQFRFGQYQEPKLKWGGMRYPSLTAVVKDYTLKAGDKVQTSQSRGKKGVVEARDALDWGIITEVSSTGKVSVKYSNGTYKSDANIIRFRKNESRKHWENGSQLEVYSESATRWYIGTVTGIGSDNQDLLTLEYDYDKKTETSAKKELSRFHQHIRPLTGSVQTEAVIRRRMAQREFSDKRDSPAMIRLLKEIAEANQRANDRD